MKKIMRTMLSVLAATAAVTTVSAAASAKTVIDFEDGVYEPYMSMKTNDGGDLSDLSVVDFNGSKQLRVEVKDVTKSPKVQIWINESVGKDHVSDIAKVQCEVTVASQDGEAFPGWVGGDLGSESLDGQVTLPWTDTQWDGGSWDAAVTPVINVEHKWLLPSKKPQNGMEDITMLLQMWANGDGVPVYLYIDNVKFLDADGNEMEIEGLGASAAPAEEPAVEAPAADTPVTTSTNTGNVPAAAFAALALLGGAAAVKSRRK